MFAVGISGDTQAALWFDQFPTFAHDRLLAALQDIEQRLEAAVIAAEPNKTGALRALTGGRVYDHGSRIAAVVGVRASSQSEALKAAALEYGSRGQAIKIRAHKMKLDHIYARAISAISVNVPDYTRTPKIGAHNFLRGPIDAMRSASIAQLEAAVEQATQDMGK